jgi:hypothetical protein
MSTRHVNPQQLRQLLRELRDRSPDIAIHAAESARERWHYVINMPSMPLNWTNLSRKWVARKRSLSESGQVTPDSRVAGNYSHKGLFTGAMRDSAEVATQPTSIGDLAVLQLSEGYVTYQGKDVMTAYTRLLNMQGKGEILDVLTDTGAYRNMIQGLVGWINRYVVEPNSDP